MIIKRYDGKKDMKTLFHKPNKRLFTLSLVAILIGVTGLTYGIYQSQSSQADVAQRIPNFTPSLPKGKTIEQLGGWQKLTPPKGGEPTWVFVDTVSGVTINVSQQRLPGNIKADTANRMADLAHGYNANTTLNVNGITVYIGTSSKGPQSVIFTKNDVLFLIKSWSTIESDAWISYIASLQ